MNLPNKLTIFTIILVPIMAIIPFFNFDIKWIVIDIIFILASITDKLDGYIARSKNQITTFGKFLDPIADKILVLAAMLILVEDNTIPAIIPIIHAPAGLTTSQPAVIATKPAKAPFKVIETSGLP